MCKKTGSMRSTVKRPIDISNKLSSRYQSSIFMIPLYSIFINQHAIFSYSGMQLRSTTPKANYWVLMYDKCIDEYKQCRMNPFPPKNTHLVPLTVFKIHFVMQDMTKMCNQADLVRVFLKLQIHMRVCTMQKAIWRALTSTYDYLTQ